MEKPPPANRRLTAVFGVILLLLIGISIQAPVDAAGSGALRIGVLLPLTGKFAAPGEAVKRGIDLAVDALSATGSSATVVYRDTQEDAARTTRAVRDLVEAEKVSVIIGPLVSATVDAAANAAAEHQVPLLALTQKGEVPHLGSYVFRHFMTTELQMKALVGYAMEQLELSRFAIVYPEKRYNMELAGAFWDEVTRRGGQMTGLESYPEKTTDFMNVARRVGGKFYTDLRKKEQRKGESDFRKAHEEAGKKPKKAYELPPIVDYDAVFVPDNARSASLVASTMAYVDIPVGGFTISRDQTAVRMLGISAWNTPELIKHGGQYMENALFVDGFFPGSPSPKTRDFVSAFQETYARPADLLAATGYDSVGLVHAVAAVGQTSRAGMLQGLKALGGYEGATGVIAFDERGELKKDLYVISVHRKSLVQLWPVVEGLEEPTPEPEKRRNDGEKPADGAREKRRKSDVDGPRGGKAP